MPSVSTDGAAATGSTYAVVDGSADPGGQATTVRAEYALAHDAWCTSHGKEGVAQESARHDIGSGDAEISEIAVPLSGLAPSTDYCAQLVAENEDGVARGGQVTFSTPKPPSVETESASHITSNDATLEATINPNGRETTYVVYLEAPSCEESGPGTCEASGGEPIYEGRIPAGSSPVDVSVDLASVCRWLIPATINGYRVEAWSETSGVRAASGGPEKTFTTTPGEASFGVAIYHIKPATGSTVGGTSVEIFGESLENLRAVYFGVTPAKVLEEECGGLCEIAPYQRLLVESPPHVAGTVDVTVETDQGVTCVTPGDRFTYAPPTEPAPTKGVEETGDSQSQRDTQTPPLQSVLAHQASSSSQTPRFVVAATRIRAGRLVLTLRLSVAGAVRIRARGVVSGAWELSAGTHRLRVRLARSALNARRHRRKTNVVVSLSVAGKTVTKSFAVRLQLSSGGTPR